MTSPDDRFQIAHQGPVRIITPSSDMQSLEWDWVESSAELALGALPANAKPLVVFDLGQVGFFGSVFLSVLLRCWRRVSDHGGRMLICCPGEHAVELLNVTALDTLWEIHPSLSEALSALDAD